MKAEIMATAEKGVIILKLEEHFQCDECEGWFTKSMLSPDESGTCVGCVAVKDAEALGDAVSIFLDEEAPCPVVGSEEDSLSDEHDAEECNFCTLREDLDTFERAMGHATR